MRKSNGHKYRAKATTVDGIRFASQKEARRYQELKLLEKAGKIHRLAWQVGYPLLAPDKRNGGAYHLDLVGYYKADFVYCDCRNACGCKNPHAVVEDVKGFRTPLYRWKKKHFEIQYGVRIREI